MTSPSAATRAWVAAAAGGTRVRRVRRLVGGITSSVHACQVETAGGGNRVVILRRWLSDSPDEQPGAVSVRREAQTLASLARTPVPAPALVASDPDGHSNDGVPALLMTRVPGSLDLSPRDPDDWLAQLAGVLPSVHAVPPPTRTFDLWVDLERAQPPASSTRPDLWRAALDLVRDARSSYEPTFIHRDYQHFNVLWSRGLMTGVVDWVEACSGPPDLDVGHCRLNLAVLFSAAAAERFRELYEAAAGRPVDPYWDVAALLAYLPGWGSFVQVQAGRLATVDRAGMLGRVEDLLLAALRRSG